MYIGNIGITYDETHFIHAALGGVTGDLIYARFHGLPLMIMPYLGALKSYLYYPIFKLFGVNAYSIRIPMIVVSIMTLIIWYENARLLTENRLFSMLFLWLIATDPFFIMYSRLDIGPTVLQNVFIAGGLWSYLRYLHSGSFRIWLLFVGCVLLGEFNKLNFIWFLLALGGAGILLHRKTLKRYFQRDRKASLVLLLFILSQLIIGFSLIVPALSGFHIGNVGHLSLIEKLIYMIKVYWLAFNGSYMYAVLFGGKIVVSSWVVIIEIVAILVWLLLMTFARLGLLKLGKSQAARKCIILLSVIFIIEWIQTIITPQARLPEHVMVMWPLMHLIFIAVLVDLLKMFGRHAAIICMVLVAVVVLSQLSVDYTYLLVLKSPPATINRLYSPAINRLSHYINSHIDEYDEILSADFGLNNQLVGLAQGNENRKKMHDIWFYFVNNPELIASRNMMYPSMNQSEASNLNQLYVDYFKGKHVLLVVYYPEIIEGIVDQLYYFANYHHLEMTYAGEIDDAHYYPVYILYRIRSGGREIPPTG